MNIIVVGGGIGGLAAALCLHAAGFHPRVLERSDGSVETGAGIQLSPNGVRVLHALGLRRPLAAIGFRPEAVFLRDHRRGRLIARRPLGDVSEERYGAPYYQVHRRELHRLLRETAETRGIPVHPGRECSEVRVTDDGVEVQAGDRLETADVLIGADGIRSRVRTGLFGPDQPRYTGHVAFRGLVPTSALSRPPTPDATAWLGPHRHFVRYPVGDGSLVNFVAVVETPEEAVESWTTPAAPGELADAFSGWDPRVRELIAAAGHVWKWALHDREPLPEWTRGRATLLGDACHPMLPFLAQGACMALEDAWILARLLEVREEDDPAPALDLYQQARRMRTARVQREAREQGERFHAASPLQRMARNLKLGTGSRLLPEIAMAHYDWLHGYDPVGRFG
jgi:salicylate hydroxylase